MASKLFAGFTVVFWLAMMAALVRVEIFPRQIGVSTVPPERVMRSIFANPEPVNLVVFYRQRPIGHCNISIPPEQRVDGSYKVHSDLKLNLTVLGVPSKMLLSGSSTFDAEHQLKDFSLRIKIADGEIELFGDDVSQKVNLVLNFGDIPKKQQFDFSEIRGAGFVNAFGLPGLANFAFLGGATTPGHLNGTTRTYYDWLWERDTRQRAYLIDSRLDNDLWAKLWVSELGEVLRVETSMGLTMKPDNPTDLP
jgi:hypothetical protein